MFARRPRRTGRTAANPHALVRVVEHDVDHAGDGVRAVLRGGAVAQHFHARDRVRGNGRKSTACAPWLTVPNGSTCRFTSAERCRRLPLISTRVWSGGRLRRDAGRTKAVPSAIGKRCVLSDGTMLVSWSVKSVDACRSRSPAEHVDRRHRLGRRQAGLVGTGHHHRTQLGRLLLFGRRASLRERWRGREGGEHRQRESGTYCSKALVRSSCQSLRGEGRLGPLQFVTDHARKSEQQQMPCSGARSRVPPSRTLRRLRVARILPAWD